MHKKAQQYDGPPSKRTRSQCPDHKALHQTLVIPTMQHLPLSAHADHPTLSCNLQSNPPQQKKRKLLQLNTKLECPGPCTRPLDPASMARAIWNYKINKARSLSASDAVNTIYFYDLEVTSIDNWRVVTTKPTNKSDQESRQQKQYHVYFAPMTIENCTPYLQKGWLHT